MCLDWKNIHYIMSKESRVKIHKIEDRRKGYLFGRKSLKLTR
jgi:hypothetical protein